MLSATRRQRGRRGWRLLLASGVVCFVAAGVPLLTSIADVGAQGDLGRIPVERTSRVQPAGPDTRVTPGVGSSRPAAAFPSPVHLSLPRLQIDAPVLPVSVRADGLLGVPDNPRELGWWKESARPAMPSGGVVIDGHVDSATLGLGALFRLREVRPGDEVVLLNAARRSTRYTVVARRSYAKTALPTAELFAADVSPRLVILTCGGAFDQATRHYADNIVVYAVPR